MRSIHIYWNVTVQAFFMRSKSVRQLRGLLSQWTCVTHIHCHGTEEAGVLGAIEQILERLKEEDEVSHRQVLSFLSPQPAA